MDFIDYGSHLQLKKSEGIVVSLTEVEAQEGRLYVCLAGEVHTVDELLVAQPLR